MKKLEYTVGVPEGLHIRPAVVLVKQAEEFPTCHITVRKEEKEADGRRLFAVLSLGVRQNDSFEILIEGEEEEQAYRAFRTFCDNNLAG